MSKDKPKGKTTKTKIRGIEQLPDGRFRVRARWTDKAGKRHKREGTVDTFAEAVALKEALRETKETNRPKQRLRFGDYATSWLETYTLRVEPSTALNVAYFLKQSIDHFGTMYLDAIELPMVRDWYAEFIAKDGSIATKNKCLKIFKQVMDQAVEDGLIERNPAKKVRGKPTPPTQGARARSLDLEGFVLLERSTRELMEARDIRFDHGRYILALLWTGCRYGEVAALRWSDVRNPKNDIVIRRGVSLGVEKETKTRHIRHVPTGTTLRQILAEQSEWLSTQSEAHRATGLVFPNKRLLKDGTFFMRRDGVKDALDKICKHADIERITPHSLRRTMEQCLRLAGVDVLVRRSILGWRTSDVQGVYAQVTHQERARAIETLEAKVHKTGSLSS